MASNYEKEISFSRSFGDKNAEKQSKKFNKKKQKKNRWSVLEKNDTKANQKDSYKPKK